MDTLEEILDTEVPHISFLPRETVQRILDEKRKSKTPCNYDTWSKLVKILGAGHFSSTREICVPKHNCKNRLAVKTTVLTKTNVFVYQNDIRALKFIDKHTTDSIVPKLIDNFECACSPLKPLNIGVEIMEYLPNTLTDYVDKQPKLPFTWWKQIFAQLLSILDTLERLRISHNDLQPDNVMMFKASRTDPVIKLIDFGSASSSNKNLTLYGGIPTFFGPASMKFESGRDLLNFCQGLTLIASKLPPKIREFCEQVEELDIRGNRVTIKDLMSA